MLEGRHWALSSRPQSFLPLRCSLSRFLSDHHPPPSLPPCSQPDPSISLPLYDSDPNLSPTSPRTALRLIPRTKQSPSRPPVGQRYPIVAPDRTHASSKFSHNTAKNANQSYPLARFSKAMPCSSSSTLHVSEAVACLSPFSWVPFRGN
ncbi:hypothetical protein FA13DRAFT_1107768 [Coprinellus micaceus]|uniref:Uncharacterized protein n=1 Tax=Coprinellus micaceus TaxID=71717 RepID=A0A4Y7RK98_COPMI|nr:hypothetical protein FA13DRAFT_1107768 [Coprinellus micaceus]